MPPSFLRLPRPSFWLAPLTLALGLAATACSSSSDSPSDAACDGVECSGHGVCVSVAGVARCACDDGFVTSGVECIDAGGDVGGSDVGDVGDVTRPDTDTGRDADADVPRDADDATDTSDAADALDTSDGSDVTDATDVTDVTDATDATDVTDVTDATDSGDVDADVGDPPIGPCDDPWCVGTVDPPVDATCEPARAFLPSVGALGPASERFVYRESPIAEPIIVDVVSQTEWTACALGLSGDDCQNGTARLLDRVSAADECDALVWGDHDDWATPPPEIALGAVDFNTRGPVPVFGTESWSDWLFGYDEGDVRLDFSVERGNSFRDISGTSTFGHAHCVRPVDPATWDRTIERCATSTLGEASQPILEDVDTGLSWTACSLGRSGLDCAIGDLASLDHGQALSACDDLEWGGFSDWELPSVEQARTLIDFTTTGNRFHFDTLHDLPGSTWTSTYEAGTGRARAYMLRSSDSIRANPLHDRSNIFCVRDGGVWDAERTDPPTRACIDRLRPRLYGEGGSDDDRFARLSAVPGEPIVADAYLGVEWMGCAAGLSGSTCSNGTAMGSATPRAMCAGLDYAELSDWRLARIEEVLSLHGLGEPFDDGTRRSPGVQEVFPNLPLRLMVDYVQRLDPRPESVTNVYGLGTVHYGGGFPLICVRDVLDPPGLRAEHCVDTTTWRRVEPVVSDPIEGLEFTACALGASGIGCTEGSVIGDAFGETAGPACDALDWAGHDDWRLPSYPELSSVVDTTSGAEYLASPIAWPESTLGVMDTLITSTPYSADGGVWSGAARRRGVNFGAAICVRDLAE